jgi:hypothetical protein
MARRSGLELTLAGTQKGEPAANAQTTRVEGGLAGEPVANAEALDLELEHHLGLRLVAQNAERTGSLRPLRRQLVALVGFSRAAVLSRTKPATAVISKESDAQE